MRDPTIHQHFTSRNLNNAVKSTCVGCNKFYFMSQFWVKAKTAELCKLMMMMMNLYIEPGFRSNHPAGRIKWFKKKKKELFSHNVIFIMAISQNLLCCVFQKWTVIWHLSRGNGCPLGTDCGYRASRAARPQEPWHGISGLSEQLGSFIFCHQM